MQKDYFTLLDILPAILWLIIIVVVGFAVRNSNMDKPHYKYYMPNLFAKLFFSFAFACVYIFYYGGGDTTAYYDGAVALNNLFLKSPSLYYEQMVNTPDYYTYSQYFDSTTGFPPHWIYKEPEGFFVCKIMSLFTFFTLKSYIASTFILAYFSSVASWKIFELILKFNFTKTKLAALGILFLPSVNFWCSGISKDTFVLIAVLFLIYNSFIVLSEEFKSSFKNWIYIFINALLIFHIRDFILLAILTPLLFSFSARLIKKMGGNDFFVITFRSVVIAIGIIGLGSSFINQSEEELTSSNSFLKEAAIIQDDFANNDSYGSKRYNLGNVEFSAVGLLKVTPIAIITGIYRPFIWEALSPTLLFNGLESLLIIYFTYFFLRKNLRAKWKKIRSHEFLVFALFFVITIAFMTGLTSGLFGVLVRLRAMLLPFLFILLTFELTTNEINLARLKK